ncbi:G5 domain-containing protein, partial [uncultured Granulicatella sp.]|uniref:G5 domain-containing protein n=1 Tax=uncultured Granulicatella sp. TaxID=316089 RepID=UPI0028E5AAD5
MRKEIFSIRKIKKIAGSVVIGSALFGMGTPVSAASPSTYHYVDEANLTEQEKALLHTEVPPQDEEVYYLIYRKIEQVLPQTGVRENMAFTAAGLLAASSIVLVVSKKKRHKILGALLITASGAATFIPSQAVAVELNQVIRATSNEGVVQIDGYRYVGYLSEKELKQISHPEQAKTTVEDPAEEVTPEVPATVVEKKEETRIETTTEEIPFETITQVDTTLEKGKSRVLYAGQPGVRTIQTQVTVVNGVETRKVLSSEVTKQPISQIIGVGAKEEAPVKPTSVVEKETPKSTPEVKPEIPKVEVTKGTQELGKEGQALTQPTLPEHTEKIEVKGTQEVKEGEKQGEALVQPVLPEYQEAKGTQEEDKKGQALTQTELPEYHEAKGVQEVQEGEKQGEALVQTLPEYRITEETTENDVAFNTEEVLDSTKYVGDDTVTREGVKGVQK